MDNDEEFKVVYTCGICNINCESYEDHLCFETYNDIYMDDNYNVYPLLGDKRTIIRSTVFADGSKKIIKEQLNLQDAQNDSLNLSEIPHSNAKKERKKSQEDKYKDDDIELLILEVQSRPPLWNHESPLEKRSPRAISILWDEVSAALNGRLTATEAKKKFKSIRDCYRKIVQQEYRASGSARLELKHKWKFYDLCEFLRDSCLIKQTASNVLSEEETIQNSTDENVSCTNENNARNSNASSTPTSKNSKKRSNDSVESNLTPLARIAEKICRQSPPMTFPSPPKSDAVDNFLTGIGQEIRKLPESDHLDLIMEIMNLVRRKQRDL